MGFTKIPTKQLYQTRNIENEPTNIHIFEVTRLFTLGILKGRVLASIYIEVMFCNEEAINVIESSAGRRGADVISDDWISQAQLSSPRKAGALVRHSLHSVRSGECIVQGYANEQSDF